MAGQQRPAPQRCPRCYAQLHQAPGFRFLAGDRRWRPLPAPLGLTMFLPVTMEHAMDSYWRGAAGPAADNPLSPSRNSSHDPADRRSCTLRRMPTAAIADKRSMTESCAWLENSVSVAFSTRGFITPDRNLVGKEKGTPTLMAGVPSQPACENAYRLKYRSNSTGWVVMRRVVTSSIFSLM